MPRLMNFFRWVLVVLLAGAGCAVLIGCVLTALAAPTFDLLRLSGIGFGLCMAAIPCHWAWMLYARQYRELGSAACALLALFVALALMIAPTWLGASQAFDGWLQGMDPLLGGIAGLFLALGWLLLPMAAARGVYRGGRALLTRMIDGPPTGRRLLQ